MSSSFTEYRAAGGRHGRPNQKKELKRLEKVIEHAEIGGAFSNARTSYNKWLRDNTGIKLLPNGKRQTVWKTGESAGKPFNEKIGKDQWRQKYYGTLTPYQDLRYLRQLEKNEVRLDRLRRNKLRIGASEKDWEGTPIHLLEVDQLEAKLNQEAEELRGESSYADFDVPVSNRNKNNNEADNNENIVDETTGGGTNEVKNNNEGGVQKTYEQNRENSQGNEVDNSETNYVDLAGGANAFNDPANQTNGTSTRERLTARERMRAQNVERFGGGEAGEWHVSKVEERNQAFQDAKRGGKEAMEDFRENYGENLGSYLRNEKLKIKPKKKKIPNTPKVT